MLIFMHYLIQNIVSEFDWFRSTSQTVNHNWLIRWYRPIILIQGHTVRQNLKLFGKRNYKSLLCLKTYFKNIDFVIFHYILNFVVKNDEKEVIYERQPQ